MPSRTIRRAAAKTPTPLTAETIMTADDVADLLKMPRSTVEDYARRGLLPSIKLGRHRRFVRGDVLAALEDLRGRSLTAKPEVRRRVRRPR
jgi:excisionase family DNA binding protein